jgi:hypothetical protein
MNSNAPALSRPIALTLLVLLLVFTFALRIWGAGTVVSDGEAHLTDKDTIRRLVRLEALAEQPGPYPIVEPRDGAPIGSMLHWTRPMDIVIEATDALTSSMLPEARPNQAGALYAGPIVGTLAVLGLVLILAAWLGWLPALGAGLFLSVSMSSVASGASALADHQVLYLFAFTLATPAFLVLLARASSRWPPIVLGLAMGLGLWTSSEVMLVFFGFVLLSALTLLMARSERRPELARQHLSWSLVLLVVCLIATAVENRSFFTFRWDTISWFHVWPVAVLALFFGAFVYLARNARWNGLPGFALSAGIAIVAGLLPFVATGIRESFGAQLSEVGEVSLWVRTAVVEFRPLLFVGGEFTLAQAWFMTGVSLILLPLVVIAMLLDRERSPELRLALAFFPAFYFALGCYESKLIPLFAIGLAPTVIVGGRILLDRIAAKQVATPKALLTTSAALLLLFAGRELWAISGLVDNEPPQKTAFDLVTDWLAEHDDSEPAPIVLAPWGMSADLLYETRCGVVATGYHRNLAGIHDWYSFIVEEAPAKALAILDRRKVDYLVTVSRPPALLDAYTVLRHPSPRLRLSGLREQRGPDGITRRVPSYGADPQVQETMLWRLAMKQGELAAELRQRLQLVYETKARSEMDSKLPLLRIYRVGR